MKGMHVTWPDEVDRSPGQPPTFMDAISVTNGWKVPTFNGKIYRKKSRKEQDHIQTPQVEAAAAGNTQWYSQSIRYPFPENQSTLLETHQVKILIVQHQVVHQLQIISTLKNTYNKWLGGHIYSQSARWTCFYSQKNRSM